MKTDLFQSCGQCWVFQICLHIECSTFIASSFGIWNSTTEIPSPPLALFLLIVPKFHLTSHSKISDSRLVITPSCLSGSWGSFLYISSVCSCHLFLISSASLRPTPFLSKLRRSGMIEFNSDDHHIYYCGQESLRRKGVAIIVNKSLKCRIWMQSQTRQNDLCSFPRQTIQYLGNPSLWPDQ